MISFLLGLALGAFLGLILGALMAAGAKADRQAARIFEERPVDIPVPGIEVCTCSRWAGYDVTDPMCPFHGGTV
jgi:hypothetical protein